MVVPGAVKPPADRGPALPAAQSAPRDGISASRIEAARRKLEALKRKLAAGRVSAGRGHPRRRGPGLDR